MSLRKDIRTAIIDQLKTILPGVHVDKWSGEDAAFNNEHQWPAVYVSYSSGHFGESTELGATTYDRLLNYDLFVGARNDQSGSGDDAAMDILETIEISLSGHEVTGAGLVEPAGVEELVAASMGRFLYGQAWQLQMLESH